MPLYWVLAALLALLLLRGVVVSMRLWQNKANVLDRVSEEERRSFPVTVCGGTVLLLASAAMVAANDLDGPRALKTTLAVLFVVLLAAAAGARVSVRRWSRPRRFVPPQLR